MLAQIAGLVSRDDDLRPRHRRAAVPHRPARQRRGAARRRRSSPISARTAPGIRLRLHGTDRLFDELDADRLDLGIGYGPLPEGGTQHKQRLLGTDNFLCVFNPERVGIAPPISLEDYVRLPHVLTTLRGGEQGIVDTALAQLGLSRTVALTTPRFVAVPFLVRGAPVVATMHSRLARYFAGALGLSTSPAPVELPDVSAALVWHASYDDDPAHRWLRADRRRASRARPAGNAARHERRPRPIMQQIGCISRRAAHMVTQPEGLHIMPETIEITDRIERSVEIDAPVSRVWTALTDHEEFGHLVPRRSRRALLRRTALDRPDHLSRLRARVVEATVTADRARAPLSPHLAPLSRRSRPRLCRASIRRWSSSASSRPPPERG